MNNEVVAKYVLKYNDLASKGLVRTANVARTVSKAAAAASIAMLGLGAAGGAAAIKLANSFAKRADDIAKFTRETDFAADSMQRLEFVAGIQGASFDGLRNGVVKFNKNLGELRGGTGELFTKLKFLNPELRDQLLATQSNEQAYWKLVKAVAATEGAENKMALAAAAVGAKAARGVIQITANGIEAIDRLSKEADKLRPPMDEKQRAAAEAYNDSIFRTRFAIGGLTDAIGAGLIPKLTPMINNFAKLVATNRELIATNVISFFDRVQKSAQSGKIKDVADATKQFIANVKAGKHDKFISDIKDIASALVEIGKAALSVGGHFADLVGGHGNAIKILFGAAVISKVAGLITVLATLSGGIKKFALGVKFAWPFVLGFVKGIAGIAAAVGIVPIAMAAAAAAVVTGTIWIVNNFDKVKEFAKSMGIDLDKTWSNIKAGFERLKNAAAAIWEGIKYAISNPIDAAKLLVAGHAQFIHNIFGSTFQNILSVASIIWSNIKAVVIAHIANIASGISAGLISIQDAWNNAMTIVSNFASEMWSGVKSLFANGVNFLIEKLNRLLELYNQVSSKIGLGSVNLISKVGEAEAQATILKGAQLGNRFAETKAQSVTKTTNNVVTIKTENGVKISNVTGSNAVFSRLGSNLLIANT